MVVSVTTTVGPGGPGRPPPGDDPDIVVYARVVAVHPHAIIARSRPAGPVGAVRNVPRGAGGRARDALGVLGDGGEGGERVGERAR